MVKRFINWLKSLFTRKKPAQKKVLEKISVTKRFNKRHVKSAKKSK